jgi:hypothetical protein
MGMPEASEVIQMQLNQKLRGVAVTALAAVCAVSFAASHSDAPMMVLDPAANITDVYTFVGNNAQGVKVLNIMMTVNPLTDPGNGVIFDKFAEDVRYSIHIAKAKQVNGNFVFDGKTDRSYHFNFSTSYKNQGTILSYGLGTEAGPIQVTGDARQNFVQRYTVQLQTANSVSILGANRPLLVPPVNVGPRTTPNYYMNGQRIQGVTSANLLPSYVRETTATLTDGSVVFAGQREDGFYADTPGIFDFLGVRSPGKDGFSGYNVHMIALQIPVNKLIAEGEYPTLGVYATTARQSVTVRDGNGEKNSGRWVQVSRMGNPLFNETLVALAGKDQYNRTLPTQDEQLFKQYAERCELAFLLNAVLGTNFVVNGRTDLVGIFIPDLIRVDLSTGPVPLAGESNFNRLSFIGGDTTLSAYTGQQVPSGWPNGRRFGDDVVDIALTAVASGPSYQTITPVSDNVDANDTVYDRVFPYGGTPWGGPDTTLH